MGFEDYLRFVFALIFVLALIGVLAVLARRMGMGFPAHAIKASSNRRLGVVEVAPVDGRRKLVLVRRDDVEHLLLLSPTEETVVERNISPPQDFRAALDAAREPDPEPGQ